MRTPASHQHYEFVARVSARLASCSQQAHALAEAMQAEGQARLRILHEKAMEEGLEAVERWLADGYKKFQTSIGKEVMECLPPDNSPAGQLPTPVDPIVRENDLAAKSSPIESHGLEVNAPQIAPVPPTEERAVPSALPPGFPVSEEVR